jgi:hypothetical protein
MTTEQMIQDAGLTAPRITPNDVLGNVVSEHYFTAANGVIGANLPINGPVTTVLSLLTFCVLTLKNGFPVTGESACVSFENFNAAIGRKVAKDNAIEKIWPLMGYALKDKLAAITESEGGEA